MLVEWCEKVMSLLTLVGLLGGLSTGTLDGLRDVVGSVPGEVVRQTRRSEGAVKLT